MRRNKELAELIRKCASIEITPEMRRAQAISFAFGNLALMYKYDNATTEELAALKQQCTDAYDSKDRS